MNLVSASSSAHFLEGKFLSLEDRIVQFPHRFTGATAHNRARDVAKITGLL